MKRSTRLLSLLLLSCILLITSCSTSRDNITSDPKTEQSTSHIHNFDEWEVIIEPTLTEVGQKVRYCSCGEKQTEIVAKLKPESDTTTDEDEGKTDESTTTDDPYEETTTEEPTPEESTTEESTTEESTTEESTTEESTTEESTTEESTTEESTTEESTTEESTTEESTTDDTPEAKRTHFTDSLDTNGPLTEGCLPSTGSPKVLVVPVNLESSNATATMLNNIEIAFNGTQTQTGWYSVSEYYSISSYGKLSLDFDVLDEWFTPSKSKSYYGSYENGDYYGSTLILDEFLEAYDDEIDFSKYDSNDDGYIDSIWLIYNCDVDYEGNSDYWAYVYWTSSEIMVDGVYACYYGFAGTDFMFEDPDSVIYPNEDIIVDAHTYIHETGHMMGLDDYYDYNENAGATGGFYWADMMDSNIGDHASINKLLLGWIDPIVISGKGSIDIDLNSFAKTGDAILIANHNITSIYDEYILIEFYTPDLLNANDEPIYPANYDSEAYGIRILHIDARICYDEYGEVTFNNDNGYTTGFLYDNSDEDKLFVDTLYCELTDEYATTDILFTPTSDSFASKYSSYKYHDGTKLNFDIEVNSMDNNGASVTITIK